MRDFIDINSNDNALFTTAMCTNRCIMCCQPPCNKNDIELLWKKNKKLIDTAPKELPSLGVTGGEPTLLKERFFELIQYIHEKLPETEIHILSNGRAFSNRFFTYQLAKINTKNVLIGIPLHSDNQYDHDLIAGAKGAFTETMKGLYNLARYSFDIELRVVLTKLNYKRLPQMANFIYKNLPFVKFVSLMGLEYTGYTVKNADRIWIEPVEAWSEMNHFVQFLSGMGIKTSIFNLSLCVLPENLWEYAKKSISDWKVHFEPFCNSCIMRTQCCGLFGTSKKQSNNLHPIQKTSSYEKAHI